MGLLALEVVDCYTKLDFRTGMVPHNGQWEKRMGEEVKGPFHNYQRRYLKTKVEMLNLQHQFHQRQADELLQLFSIFSLRVGTRDGN
ncbi:unnamed protein product [Sphenostylis stenocarpa]|uniref:Uncharacterized protein n=1 Tax=Sphenostylis stenocarpa TaxID=92480 RepID=A0AA86SZJ2_9FABA|nr:unnamed protein product [Sphenostylis stenocarpa]